MTTSSQAKQDQQPGEAPPKETITKGISGVSKHQSKETKEPAEQKEQQDKQQLRELTSILQHLQADFENYKKRIARDQEEHKQFAKKELLLNLLPIIDAFELALQDLAKETKDEQEKGEQECKTSSARKGLELIYAQLYTLLEKEGVKKIDSLHQLYNPLLHEAIMTEKTTPSRKNTVVEEFQAGYAMHGRVLRPAKVKIAIE